MEDAFAIAEIFVSFESSVASVAAVTDTTKSLVVAQNLHYAFVCHKGSRGSFKTQFLRIYFVIAEVINGKRFRL